MIRGIVVAFFLVSLVHAPASAHGGEQVFIGDVGPYQAEVYSLVVSGDQGRRLDYSLYLRDRDTKRPVNNASITLEAETKAGPLGPFDVLGFMNLYNVEMPVPATGEWSIIVSIDGPQGPATLRHSLTVGSSWLSGPWIAIFLGIAAVAGLLVYWWLDKKMSQQGPTG